MAPSAENKAEAVEVYITGDGRTDTRYIENGPRESLRFPLGAGVHRALFRTRPGVAHRHSSLVPSETQDAALQRERDGTRACIACQRDADP